MKQTSQINRSLTPKPRPLATTCFQNGFTLIEVLMVMSIFSIGILAIMALHVTAINSNMKARAILVASTLLTDQFEKLISAEYSSTELDPGGTASRVEKGILVEHTVFTTPIPNIKQIDLAVTPGGPSGGRITVTYYKRSSD